jgi:hypothetical protein
MGRWLARERVVRWLDFLAITPNWLAPFIVVERLNSRNMNLAKWNCPTSRERMSKKA